MQKYGTASSSIQSLLRKIACLDTGFVHNLSFQTMFIKDANIVEYPFD